MYLFEALRNIDEAALKHRSDILSAVNYTKRTQHTNLSTQQKSRSESFRKPNGNTTIFNSTIFLNKNDHKPENLKRMCII